MDKIPPKKTIPSSACRANEANQENFVRDDMRRKKSRHRHAQNI